MAVEIRGIKGTLFQCEECKLKYRDKETAERCQEWCGKHQSCNLEIIKDAAEEEKE